GRGKHSVTVKTEHKAALDTCAELQRQGFEVTYLDVGADGLLDLDAFRAALRPDTLVAAVMLVNHEIGATQDSAAMRDSVRHPGGAPPRHHRGVGHVGQQ